MLKIKHIEHQSETSLSIYFDEGDEADISLEIALLSEHLRESLMPLGVTDVIPCAASLFLGYHVLKTDVEQLVDEIRLLLKSYEASERKEPNQDLLELPIYYHPDVAPDLAWLAKEKNLTIDEVTKIHSEADYTVASLGFAPGFAYLSGMDSRLATSRLSSPKSVAKGSLGIADQKTAVYPNLSPGGWVIIGNCPITLFDIDAEPITPFKVGMTVKFRPVTRAEFLAKGGVL